MQFFKNLSDYRLKKIIKKAFRKIFYERNIMDSDGYIPVVKKIDIKEYGMVLIVDLQGICSYSKFENELDFIKTVFKAYKVDFSVINGDCKLAIYTEPLAPKNFYKVNLEPYELLLGYNYEGNIIADMRICPHLLVTGLSGQGKSYMLKSTIKNLQDSADVVLINAFKSDFKDFRGRFIIGERNVLSFLKSLLEVKIQRNKPIYIVIDELLTLIRNKEIGEIIAQLLAIGRHYNIFLICIAQQGTKESVKFKNLFNARVCFKFIEDSSYKAVLGVVVAEQLEKQEFYFYGEGLYKGRTFEV